MDENSLYGYRICMGGNEELNLANDLLFDCIKKASNEFYKRLNDELPELIRRAAKDIADDTKDRYNAELIEHLVEIAFIEDAHAQDGEPTEKHEYMREAPETTCLYIIEGGESHKIKIGIARDIKNRLANLQTSNPEELTVINQMQFDYRSEALEAESELHEYFKLYRICPKGRATEWFQPEIKSLATQIRKEHLPVIAEANERERQKMIEAVNSVIIPM